MSHIIHMANSACKINQACQNMLVLVQIYFEKIIQISKGEDFPYDQKLNICRP